MNRARGRLITPALAALAGITILGGGLRLFRLGHESFWMEEAFSLELAKGTLSYLIDRTASDAHPPLYYLLLHYWRLVFGDTEVAVRLMSVLFGTLTIPALYRLGARLFDRPTGLVTALLYSLSVPNIGLAREARMQPLLLLLTVLSMDYFYQMVMGAKGRVFAAYVVVSTLMLYTQYYGFFTLAAQGMFLGAVLVLAPSEGRAAFWRCTAGAVLSVLLFLPWLPVFKRQLSGVEESFWILRVKLRGLIYGVSEYAGAGALGRIVRPIAVIGALVGLAGPIKPEARSPRLAALYLLIWIAAAAGIPWAISQVSSPIFLPRYAMSASLALLMLAARGLTWLPGVSTKIAATSLVVALSVAELPAYFGDYHKDQWRVAVAHLEAAAQPGDVILFDWGAGKMPFDYYSRRSDLIGLPLTIKQKNAPADAADKLVVASTDGHERVWLMLSHPDPIGSVALTYLQAHYRQQSTDDVPGVMTYLFVK